MKLQCNWDNSNFEGKLKKVGVIACKELTEEQTLKIQALKLNVHTLNKCDLSRENVQQRFSVERLKQLAIPVGYPLEALIKALEKPLGFFLYPLKALKKAVGKFLPTVGNVGKSRWVLFPYPLKALRKAVGKIRPTRCYSAVNSLIYGSD